MKKITIVGAGIAGLTAAIVLRRHGHSVTVLERSARLDPIGAGIVLAPNAVRALEALGVDLAQCGHRLNEITIRDADGTTLQSINLKHLLKGIGPALSFQRGELHQALLAALPGDVALHLGCSSVDCSQLDADLIVGADGIRSTVRTQTLGPIACVTAAPPAGWASFPIPVFTMDSRAGEGVRASEWRRSLATASMCFSCSTLHTAHRDRLQSRTSRIHFATLPIQCPRFSTRSKAASCCTSIWKSCPRPSGEAAAWCSLVTPLHAMTPNLGQGAAAAIQDAINLPAVLSSSSPACAMESLRHAHIEWLQKSSRRFGQIAHWQSPVSVWARNLLIRITPQRLNDHFYLPADRARTRPRIKIRPSPTAESTELEAGQDIRTLFAAV